MPRDAPPARVVSPGFVQRVYAVVRRVPAGSVTTYGDVAAELGARSVARHVGNALAQCREQDDVPWQRVVSARGVLSPRADGRFSPEQRALLALDGVQVDDAGRVLQFRALRYVFTTKKKTGAARARGR